MFDSKKIGFFLFSTKIMNGTFDSAYIICCVCGAVPFDGILQCCREKKNLYKSFYIKLKRFAWRNLLLFFYFSFVGFVFFSLLSYFNFDNRRKPGKTPKKKNKLRNQQNDKIYWIKLKSTMRLPQTFWFVSHVISFYVNSLRIFFSLLFFVSKMEKKRIVFSLER